MTLKPRNYFGNLFDKTKALDKLLDEIGEIRSEKITRKIQF